MSRYIVNSPVLIAFLNYTQPGRVHKKGDVIELAAAEVTAIGAGNLRPVTTATVHDQQGEAVAVSNGS